MKKLFGVFILLIIVVLATALTKDNTATMRSLQRLLHTPTVSVKGQTFNVILAKTDAEKEKGLSGRSSLPKNEGMLFLFDKADYYAFWMKDMLFPIDIIYIHDKQIITVYNNLQPPAKTAINLQIVKPSEPADTVLEINAGLAQQYHLQTGDIVTFSL
ncbi:MAG: DUF192 domain-containing protein [Patescibacteria group bacterium]|nr:DUF192 domain-containing protein [Patescibacteria group bacterium]MDE2589211.1 DUF192 domain-containing protein [Patescibacteria group bacterium]